MIIGLNAHQLIFVHLLLAIGLLEGQVDQSAHQVVVAVDLFLALFVRRHTSQKCVVLDQTVH